MQPVTFIRTQELIPGVWQSFFKPDNALDYQAGQYCEFIFDNVPNDTRGPARTFTLTSMPTDECLSIVYRAVEPMSAYKQQLLTLKTGARLHIGEILGDLVLPKLTSVPLVFAASGIGMASFVAMLRVLESQAQDREIHLFYRLRHVGDDAFRTLTSRFPFASIQTFVAPKTLHAQDIVTALPNNALIYLSGSERFTLKLRDELRELNVNPSRIVYDYYDGYADL